MANSTLAKIHLLQDRVQKHPTAAEDIAELTNEFDKLIFELENAPGRDQQGYQNAVAELLTCLRQFESHCSQEKQNALAELKEIASKQRVDRLYRR